MTTDLTRHIEAIATFALGNPNPTHSTRSQWRYGTNGSVAVEVTGAKAGIWYDHEAKEGGGPWELLLRKLADKDIPDWLARNLGVHLERAAGGHIVAVYPYYDESGRLLFEVCRLAPKRFRQRRPSGEWGIQGVRRVLYRLPELIAAPKDAFVYIPEGEKDCDRLATLWGLVTTCNPMGAGKWRDEYAKFFRGRHVVILPDNDKVGRQHATQVAKSLLPVAASVRVLYLYGLPDKGDVSDWVASGGTQSDLLELAEATPLFQTDDLGADERTPRDPAADDDEDDDDARPGPADDAEIARLRAVYLRSSLAYDRIRQAEAEKLGVRVTTLDRLVQGPDHDNGNGKPGQGRPLEFPPLEPWPHPVDGANLLEDIAACFLDYVVLPESAAHALALWITHTHAREAATAFPRLVLASAEMRSGKTTTLHITGAMVARPLSTANTTSAAIYRTIEACSPTLLIDEADTFVADDPELKGIFNAGFLLGGEVIRTVGDDHEPRRFRCDGPVAFAGIGKLPGTMEDRAIKIAMRRKRRDEPVERFRPDRLERFKQLAQRAARWVQDNLDQLRMIDDPDVPEALHDRAADCWRPLLAIAELAGGEWPQRARTAARALTQSTEDSASNRVLLLADLRELFDGEKSGVLFTTEILEALHERVDRPWCEYGRRHDKITARGVASLLKPLGIKTNQDLWRGSDHARGYRREDFEDAFARYLTPSDQ
jgi:hypothetical protein